MGRTISFEHEFPVTFRVYFQSEVTGDFQDHKGWVLKLAIPCYSDEKISVHLSAVWDHNTKRDESLFAKFAFTIFDHKRKKLGHVATNLGQRFSKNVSLGFTDFLDVSKLPVIQHRRSEHPLSLIILCEVEYLDDPNPTCDFLLPPLGGAFESGYSYLLDTGFCTDLALHSKDGGVFATHKAILGAQSKLFRRRFEQEPDIRKLEITDISADCLATMLRFMYTGVLKLKRKSPIRDLLPCAKKYGLDGLILICCLTLEECIDASNAANRLMLAERYKNDKLKLKSMKFINEHLLAVKETKGWKRYVTSNPVLLEALFKMSSMPRVVTDRTFVSQGMDEHTKPPLIQLGRRQDDGPLSFEYCFSVLPKEFFYRSNFEDATTGRIWCLVLSLERFASATYVSLRLKLCAAKKEETVNVQFSFLILDADDQRELYHFPPSFQKFTFSGGQTDSHGYDRFMTIDGDGSSIIVLCTIEDSRAPKSHADIFFEDFNNLLETGLYSDVALCVEGDKLKAHKAILGARSPVFRAMFEHEMQENLESKVEIPDASLDCVKAFLSYLYGNVKPDQSKVPTADLLAIAEKYQVKCLKQLCETKLCTDTTVSNVCEMVVLARLYQALILEKHAMEFVASNISVVARTDGWHQHIQNNAELLEQLYSSSVFPVTTS